MGRADGAVLAVLGRAGPCWAVDSVLEQVYKAFKWKPYESVAPFNPT